MELEDVKSVIGSASSSVLWTGEDSTIRNRINSLDKCEVQALV